MEIQDVNRIKNKWFFSETGLYVVMSTHKIVESDKTNNVSCGSKNIYINFDFFKKTQKVQESLRLFLHLSRTFCSCSLQLIRVIKTPQED